MMMMMILKVGGRQLGFGWAPVSQWGPAT